MKLQAGTVMRFHGTKHGLLLYMRKVQIRAQGSDLLGSARALVVRAQVPCGDRQERRDARTSARVLSVETCRLCVCSRRLLLFLQAEAN